MNMWSNFNLNVYLFIIIITEKIIFFRRLFLNSPLMIVFLNTVHINFLGPKNDHTIRADNTEYDNWTKKSSPPPPYKNILDPPMCVYIVRILTEAAYGFM